MSIVWGGLTRPMQFINGELLKISLILLLCMLPAFVLCTTRTVSLDGTQQYTNIQSAVNASVNGDVILVSRQVSIVG